MTSTHRPRRWTIKELIALTPHSSQAAWERLYLPQLVDRGTLIPRDQGWVGHRAAIEAALTNLEDQERAESVITSAGVQLCFSWLRLIEANATYPRAAIALATGGMSAALNWGASGPLLVLGAGLLAGRLARYVERERTL